MKRIRQAIFQAPLHEIPSTVLGIICLCLVAGMLVAGLWPFHSPKNQVSWLAGANGLRFGRHGTILSYGKFTERATHSNSPCSIEILLEPALTATSATILAFYAPKGSRRISLHQSVSDLVVRSESSDGGFRSGGHRVYVEDVFRSGKPLFITITSDGAQIAVYLDGLLVRTVPDFPISSQDFQGELVVANSPTVDNSWSGTIRGFALYARELSASDVRRHFQSRTTEGAPDPTLDEASVALYRFNEGVGRVVHNQVTSAPDLYVPDRYLIFHEVFLDPFWKEFHPDANYWSDVLINIVGFVPLGYFLCAYFSIAAKLKKPAANAVLIGFLLSLTIEVTQSVLPTRDSGTTDLMTNTLGTYLGVLLYRAGPSKTLLDRLWSAVKAPLGDR